MRPIYYLRRRRRRAASVGQPHRGVAGGLIALALLIPLVTAALIGLGASTWAVSLYNSYAAGLPDAAGLLNSDLPQTTRLYDRTGTTVLTSLYLEDRDIVDYEAIPPALVQATVATEDHSFWTNNGVDALAIIRAVLSNNGGNPLQGASTITQQLVKNLLLRDTSQTYERKIRESILAVRVSDTLTKEQTIALYLNDNYYGEGAYGVSAAARRYFGKPLAELNLAQNALIAGLAQSPSADDPFTSPAAAKSRQAVVLAAMVRAGYISAGQSAMAYAADLELVPYIDPVPANSASPWFVNRAIEEAAAAVGGMETLKTCGCRVITTLDLGLQALAVATLDSHLTAYTKTFGNVHTGALVAEDPATGEVLAYVGSADYNDASAKVQGQFDGAGQALRSPGSTWKLVTYLAAMEKGQLSAASEAWDVSTTFATGYTPHDISGDNSGPMTIRQAVRESRNIVAIRTMMANGGPTVMAAMAARLGVQTTFAATDLGPAAAIGTNSVTLTDMAAAYSTASNLGVKVPQHKIIHISDAYGTTLFDAASLRSLTVVDPKLAYTMINILEDNTNPAGSSMTGALANIGRPAIVKTGTENDTRDTYTMGGVPQLVVGVWIGNADNSAMPSSFHSYNGPLPVWKAFIEGAIKLEGYAASDWQRPDGMIAQTVCANNAEYGGMGIPEITADCPWGTSSEWVIPGFNDSDTQYDLHGALAGLLPTDGSGKLVDRTCDTAVWVDGVLARAEEPAWQPQLEAWVASARAGNQNQGGRFAWNTYNWILPGGTCPAAPSPSPSPSPTPSPSPSPSPTPTPVPTTSPTAAPTASPAPTSSPTAASTASPVPTTSPTSAPATSPVPSSTPTAAPAANESPSPTPLP
jgi:membrane peptidoglycan carboxypeptidase